MSVSFRILPEYGVVYIRYQGLIRLEETMQAFGQYLQHPQRHPGQKHLVDLSEVTGMQDDYLTLMQIQAKKAEAFLDGGAQTLMLYFAPTRDTQKFARLILQSWEGLDAIVPLLQDNEAQALTLLGIPHRSFAQMLEGTSSGR